MRILICTGIYPPDIGGPAEYAKNLEEEFLKREYKIKVLFYRLEKKMPIVIRHFFYFFRIILNIRKANLIIALDTFSVGFPAVCASKIFKRKIILRTGGDFLWESYVEKTGDLITLKDFYEKMPKLPLKQKLIFYLQGFIFKNCDFLIFSTKWQKDIFIKAYNFNPKKSYIIENFYGEKLESIEPKEKNFLWAGRLIKLKNLEILKESFKELKERNIGLKIEINSGIPYEKVLEKIKDCYAVILPSLTDISPNFIIDTIRFNKPFILTKETGLHDKLKNIGVFIDPLNKEDIKNKIILLSEEKNYNEYKSKIIKFNFTHSWKDIADEFLNIYFSATTP